MPFETFSQMSLGTAALVIFIVCVAFIFLRGLTRMILGAIVLCGSAWVGFTVWQMAPTWAIEWTGKPHTWITTGLPILAFIATFLLARLVFGFFLRPFKGGDSSSKTPMGIVMRLVIAIVPTAFLWLTGATLVHHFGSIAEIKASTETPAEQKKEQPWFEKMRELKDTIASIVPVDWLAKLDPLADASHLSLAKLIAAQPSSDLKPVIDPKTGKPYPRAIIVNSPELQDLASDGRFSTMLRHPLFQKALNDPKVQKAIKEHLTAK
jgi:hypothetical protein